MSIGTLLKIKETCISVKVGLDSKVELRSPKTWPVRVVSMMLRESACHVEIIHRWMD